MTVESAKAFLVVALSLSRDSLHIYVSLIVFFAVALLFKRSIRTSWWPWVAVLLVAIAGEVVDLRGDHVRLGYLRWDASVHDIINTLFWPTALTLLARWSSVFREGRA